MCYGKNQIGTGVSDLFVEIRQTALPSEIVFPTMFPQRGTKAHTLVKVWGQNKYKMDQKKYGMAIQLPKMQES